MKFEELLRFDNAISTFFSGLDMFPIYISIFDISISFFNILNSFWCPSCRVIIQFYLFAI